MPLFKKKSKAKNDPTLPADADAADSVDLTAQHPHKTIEEGFVELNSSQDGLTSEEAKVRIFFHY